MSVLRIAIALLSACLVISAQGVSYQSQLSRDIERAAELEIQGQAAEAEQLIRSVLKRTTDLEAAHAFNELGLLYCVRNKEAESERCYKRAIRIVEKSTDPARGALMARLLLNLGALYIETSRYRDAERLNISEYEGHLTDPFDVNQAAGFHAAMLAARGRLAEAQEAYVSTLPYSRTDSTRRGRVSLATTLNNLGAISYIRKDPERAVQYFNEAVEIWRTMAGPGYPTLLKTQVNLAAACLQARHVSEAVSHLRSAWTMSKETFGPNDSFTLGVQLAFADALKKSGATKEAKQLRKEAQQARGFTPVRASDHVVNLSSLLSRSSGDARR